MDKILIALGAFLFGLYCGNQPFRSWVNRMIVGLVCMITGKKRPIQRQKQQTVPPRNYEWIRPDIGKPEPVKPKVDITDKYDRREYLEKNVSDQELIDLLVKRGRLTQN
jgi:hypothetical protein